MKAFLVGLVTILVFAAMAGGCFLLFPFFMLTAFFLRIFLVVAFVIFCIWLLGKLIIMLFDDLKERKKP
jgi:hypothetical protein